MKTRDYASAEYAGAEYAGSEYAAVDVAVPAARGVASPWLVAAARAADFFALAKPRIVVLELIVAAAAACIAGRHTLDPATVLAALVGTALVAGSASVANQVIERRLDARMRRTAQRPLAAGRVAPREAAVLSAITLAAGLWLIAARVNWLTCLLGAASWMIYVALYTPLKTRTPLNTAVGAVAGAIPILMGWTATGAPLTLAAFALAGVLFLWQFPHFMAIAWLYRRDYAAVGMKMVTVVDPSGIRAGMLAIVGALFVVPVSLIPAIGPTAGSPVTYSLWTVAWGGAQLAFAIRFALARDDASARQLLRATLVYLPAWIAMLVAASV